MNSITEYPKQKALGSLISEQATQSPGRTAIKFKGATLSYKNLLTQVNQLAALLIAKNIKVGDVVGLAVDRSADMVIALLAILKAGAAYVPLDPGFPADRLNFMLADSGACLLITSKPYSALFESDTPKIFLEDALTEAASLNAREPGITLTGTDLAYILYTSGSTGLPKGVQIEHHNLVNFLLSMQATPGLTRDDVLLSVTTISFDIAGLELFLPLITGATLIIADSDTAKDGRALLDMVKKEKVTIMQATPYTWRMMLAAGWNKPLPLKILCGGEALPKKLADNLLPICASLWNMYGPTETTIWSTIKKITSTDAQITIGLPIANTQVYILGEDLKPVPQGQTGEICIGGDGVARGYLNRPELNAERFIDDTFSENPQYKVYRTGDLGKINTDGDIQCLGRMDHQVKIRGYRIEIEEIEHNITKLHNVNEAVVTVYTDALDNQRLIAYVQLKDDSLPIDLKDYSAVWTDSLKGKLPDYMLPNDYVIIKDLPLTPNGKIDRKALPNPVFTTHPAHGDSVKPATETEKLLSGLWSKYLGVKDIGITDNFFELGGHSIVAVQIMVEIEKITGQRLPIAILFKHPTICHLAQWIDNAEKNTTWKSLVPIKKGGDKVPLYIIHGEGLNLLIFNGLANNLSPDQPVYGLQSLGLNGFDEQLDTIEEIAAHYNSEILDENPVGPYAIAGYSLGGFIAIEMVKQLEAKGKQVKFLGMMDTNNKLPDGSNKTQVLVKKLKRQFPKGLFLLKSLALSPVQATRYQSLYLKAKFQETLAKFGLYTIKQPDGIPVYMNKLVEKLQNAVRNYRVTPYDGRIYLFRAKTRLYFVDDFKTLGWKNFAKKGVVVNDVPGDHQVMLLPPNDKQFAKVLQKVLDEAANS